MKLVWSALERYRRTERWPHEPQMSISRNTSCVSRSGLNQPSTPDVFQVKDITKTIQPAGAEAFTGARVQRDESCFHAAPSRVLLSSSLPQDSRFLDSTDPRQCASPGYASRNELEVSRTTQERAACTISTATYYWSNLIRLQSRLLVRERSTIYNRRCYGLVRTVEAMTTTVEAH